MTQDNGAPLSGRATAATQSNPQAVSSKAGIPSAAPGHWDSLAGCFLAEEYATKTRADLCHGDLSDFVLANRQYMAGRNDLDLVAWQTAAKERIRWLSTQLVLARKDAPNEPLPDTSQDNTHG